MVPKPNHRLKRKMPVSTFVEQHIGVSENERREMLDALGVSSLEKLILNIVPSEILLKNEMSLPEGLDEFSYLKRLKSDISKNQIFKSYIGMGYHPTITPSVIRKNLFENPGWYTPYTPYQAEVSQGRLEALFNFQTVISDMTGFEVANSSLLDEATSAAEAMTLLFRSRPPAKQESNSFFVSDGVFPQTIDVLLSRAEPLGIKIEVGCEKSFPAQSSISSFYGALFQYPNQRGEVSDLQGLIRELLAQGVKSVMACDLMALGLLKPPAELGADIAVGSSQRFGVPMGYGGPHAAFFSCKEKYKRQVPGRIIGMSRTIHGEPAYRMALQTREQHIRREKATSNICTAQSLLASMAGMYAVHHGPQGIKNIAEKIHALTHLLQKNLLEMGYSVRNESFFDTLLVGLGRDMALQKKIEKIALSQKLNFRYTGDSSVGISLNETTSSSDVQEICGVLAKAKGIRFTFIDTPGEKPEEPTGFIPESLRRESPYLEHPVFKEHHSESLLMRYMKSLENKDISLTNSMIPLGSCTMKLNSAVEMTPLAWGGVGDLHPFAPKAQAMGYSLVVSELEGFLKEITGFSAVSFQPNSGAQGEYAGLMAIRAYHKKRSGGSHASRDVVLIPTSAHGTNPASAVMAGLRVVLVSCDEEGNIKMDELNSLVERHSKNLAGLMLTYPSTHGIFEENIVEVCELIHNHGGLIYMDGANMNAQVGLTNPALIGADVCHLNLHKTFAIPHGGGGPGMGPIAVNKKLRPYLPSHIYEDKKDKKVTQAMGAVSASPLGSASILLISHAYVSLMGRSGLRLASECAILNANYIKHRLEKAYPVLFTNPDGFVAHELIVDLRGFKKYASIEAEDIAKRLMDYGFHAPTLSWPVPGTMMIEPTESESKTEIDRFCGAMIAIREEIQKIESGVYSREDNPIRNAPHTHEELASNDWSHAYTREEAAYPLPYLRKNKYWPPVGRIDNAYGDRNLVCSCAGVKEHQMH